MTRSKGPYLQPLRREDCPALEPTWAALEEFLGFVPNAELIMARMPRSTAILVDAVRIFFSTASLPTELLSLVGMLSSSTAGCDYCASHNLSKAYDDGDSMQKMAVVWEFETHPLFSDAERAALAFTVKASSSPNAVTKADVDLLLTHYTETEVTEITAVVSMFGIFNRFNDSVAVTLESTPLTLAKKYLDSDRWQVGVHAK
ncbi:MAG: carboxymuconolactone decarboxylase family protein [Pseudomonadota bacterium]